MRRFFRSFGIGLLLLVAGEASAAPLVPDPVINPQGAYTGWVGSTSFTFDRVISGRIYYTVDGSAPNKDGKGSTEQYEPGTAITLNRTTLVRAIHVAAGMVSNEVSAAFVRAKAPTPIAHYGTPPNPRFYPTLPCTLTVAPTQTTATIRYTLTDSAAGPTSPVYTGPFLFNKSQNLRAFAQANGYDDSDPLKIDFVLEPAALPVISPDPGKFSTNTLAVRIKSATPGAHIRYTTDPAATPDKWALLSADSLVLQGGHDGDSIHLRAQAFVSAYQVSGIASANYVYLPAVAAPTISPAPKTFYDTLTVQLASATAGAGIRYSDDNGTPSKESPGKILLAKPTTLKAYAYKANHDNSPTVTFAYPMRLTQPLVDKPDQDFTRQITVRLRAINPYASLFYTLDGLTPALVNGKIQNGVPYDTLNGITITDTEPGHTTVLKAIAVVEVISSDLATYSYTQNPNITSLSVPGIDPPDREFMDTLSIRLSTDNPNAEIRYTLTPAGQDPTQSDRLALPDSPIRIDTSYVLRCRAFPKTGTPQLDPSPVREARYTLKPSPPVASPLPGDPLPAGSVILLRTRTRHGIIHYSLDPAVKLETTQAFPDSVPVTLNASCTLRAQTFLGTGAGAAQSDLLTLRYEIYTTAPSETLTVGGTRTLPGGIVFLNQSPQPILAHARTGDDLGLKGFADLSLIMSLQPAQAGQSLKVAFSKPAGTAGSLYRAADGKVELITSKDTAALAQPGDYFVARDVQKPVITVLKEIPKQGDSTAVRLSVTDNVVNPTCVITSPGAKGGSIVRKLGTDTLVVVNLKGAAGDPKALWMRVTARDAYDSAQLPEGAQGKLYVSQLWSKVNTPGVFTIGQGQDYELWDMVGLPVGAGANLKWSDLRNANANLQACVYDNASGYQNLDDSTQIKPGMAFWVGSRSRYSALSIPQLRVGESDTDGNFRIRLKPGWNQITSPSLERVYWPVTPAASKTKGPIKAPYRFDRNSPEFWHQTDTLEPWIGYFVYSYWQTDTVITAYADAAKRKAAKIAAGDDPAHGIGLSFSAGASAMLRLGARAWADDGLGPEDEPDPPAWGDRWSAWAQRGSSHLLTDLVRFQPGAVARWQVVLGPGKAGSAAAVLNVRQGDLPAGYEAWAVSRTRGLKFPLTAGAAIPVSTDAPDTLSILAGPSEALAAVGELSRAGTQVNAFAFGLESVAGKSFLRVDLPWTGAVEASVWTLSGRRLATARPGILLPGVYRLPLKSGFRDQAAVLRLRVVSESGSREFSRRIVW
jgi:hypothetical protein